MAAIGCCFGFVNSLTQRVAPKPDYYKLLFTELARQTSLQSGTPTIVKEDEHTLALFEREYNARNARHGLTRERVFAPKDSVMLFTFLPGAFETVGARTVEIPFYRIIQEQARPTVSHDEDGWHPIVVWVYSRNEHLLACFVDILVTPDHPFSREPPHPDTRIIKPIDWEGTVSVQGSIPNLNVFLEQAYLIPLDNLRPKSLDPRSKDTPDFWTLYHVLPGVTGSEFDPAEAPATPTAGETLALLRARAMRPFLITRRVFRLGVLPLGVLWLGLNFWRMGRLHQKFSKQIDELTTASLAKRRISFRAFLTADLGAEIVTAEAKVRALQEQALVVERERTEIKELKEELHRLVADYQLSPEGARRIDLALASESLVELRELTAGYRQKREREAEIARERQREIQWLESEFEAISTIKRNEIPEAWNLYQQAISFDDRRVRLHWLKEARKKLPREFKSEAL